MLERTRRASGDWAVAIATLAGVLIALALLASAAEAGTSQPGGLAVADHASLNCGDVVVKFQPEGSGGAHAISATHVGCGKAREVAARCVKGTVAGGWVGTTWDGKVTLASGDQKVRYVPVGGGGCGYEQQNCNDFGYRGVGFFGMQAVGIGCGGAKSKAKAWYDQGAPCSFGSSCAVGNYNCKGNSKTATVTCSRQNGFRFRWQMGE